MGKWPTFRAEIIEAGVLAKLKEFLANERVRKAVNARIAKRTKKQQGETRSLENRLAEIRSRIERGTTNLALAAVLDVPGISRLLAEWREEANEVKAKLERIRTPNQPTPEALETIRRYDELLEDLGQADRVKLAYAIRQTVKRSTLRREMREQKPHHVVLWTGTIELHDEFGENATIQLTDDDIPSVGSWRQVVQYVRERGDTVFIREVVEGIGTNMASASRFLSQAVLAGKLENVGVKQGWRAIK